ncbi:MAG: class I SAM-dependent methyltransferase [Candidatus Hydrogenedens sp.]
MIENVLKDEIIHLLANIFSRVLTINFFDEKFILQVKQKQGSSLKGIITDDTQNVPCEDQFNCLYHITLGREELPFENNSFTLVIGENILSDCFNLAQTINELNRVLINDGILITAEPNVQYYRHVLKLLQGTWDDTLEESKTRLHFFTPSSVATILNNSSFLVRVLSPIEIDSADSFPLSEDGFVHVNRYHIGPLSHEEYRVFLIKKFLAVASKTNGGDTG